jgi:hypothetical protein
MAQTIHQLAQGMLRACSEFVYTLRMRTAKLTAVTPHGTFTRSTDHGYTHVVLSPVSDGDIEGAQKLLDRDLADLARIPEGESELKVFYDASQTSWRVLIRRRLEKDVAKSRAYLQSLLDRRANDQWLVCSWHTSRALAEKQANKMRGLDQIWVRGRGCRFEVFAVQP